MSAGSSTRRHWIWSESTEPRPRSPMPSTTTPSPPPSPCTTTSPASAPRSTASSTRPRRSTARSPTSTASVTWRGERGTWPASSATTSIAPWSTGSRASISTVAPATSSVSAGHSSSWPTPPGCAGSSTSPPLTSPPGCGCSPTTTTSRRRSCSSPSLPGWPRRWATPPGPPGWAVLSTACGWCRGPTWSTTPPTGWRAWDWRRWRP